MFFYVLYHFWKERVFNVLYSYFSRSLSMGENECMYATVCLLRVGKPKTVSDAVKSGKFRGQFSIVTSDPISLEGLYLISWTGLLLSHNHKQQAVVNNNFSDFCNVSRSNLLPRVVSPDFYYLSSRTSMTLGVLSKLQWVVIYVYIIYAYDVKLYSNLNIDLSGSNSPCRFYWCHQIILTSECL